MAGLKTEVGVSLYPELKKKLKKIEWNLAIYDRGEDLRHKWWYNQDSEIVTPTQ